MLHSKRPEPSSAGAVAGFEGFGACYFGARGLAFGSPTSSIIGSSAPTASS